MITRLVRLCQSSGSKGTTSTRMFPAHVIPDPLKRFFVTLLMVIWVFVFVSCTTSSRSGSFSAAPVDVTSPRSSPSESKDFLIRIDGSELVAPVSKQIAEEFMTQHPDVGVVIESNGTYTGFKRLCQGEVQINEASLGPYSLQYDQCEQNSIEWVELPVARAGFGVYVSSQNSFVQCVSEGQIERLWDAADTVGTWKELDSQWPDGEIERYAQFNDDCVPAFFDDPLYEEVQRLDYFDPGVVHALAADPFGVGIFSTIYHAQNKELLRQVGLFGDEACPFVTPLTAEPGRTPSWGQPFTVYVNRRDLRTYPTIAEFLKFYMKRVPDLLPEAGFFVLFPEDYEDNLDLIMNEE